MKKMFIKLFAIALVAFALTSCGKNASSSNYFLPAGVPTDILGEWVARNPMGGQIGMIISEESIQGPEEVLHVTYKQVGTSTVAVAHSATHRGTGETEESDTRVEMDLIDNDTLEIGMLTFHRYK